MSETVLGEAEDREAYANRRRESDRTGASEVEQCVWTPGTGRESR